MTGRDGCRLSQHSHTFHQWLAPVTPLRLPSPPDLLRKIRSSPPGLFQPGLPFPPRSPVRAPLPLTFLLVCRRLPSFTRTNLSTLWRVSELRIFARTLRIRPPEFGPWTSLPCMEGEVPLGVPLLVCSKCLFRMHALAGEVVPPISETSGPYPTTAMIR
jgi:hypothetical protein